MSGEPMRPWVLVLSMLTILAGMIAVVRVDSKARRPDALPVDSAKVVVLKDTVRALDSAARRSLDSLRQEFKRRPVREVVRWLPGGRDTLRVPPVVESVMVAAPMLRETADSLATCQVQRSAALDSSALWRVRESMAREALELCRTRPQVVGDTNPPSRATWAAVGAAGALLGVSTILLLVR